MPTRRWQHRSVVALLCLLLTTHAASDICSETFAAESADVRRMSYYRVQTNTSSPTPSPAAPNATSPCLLNPSEEPILSRALLSEIQASCLANGCLGDTAQCEGAAGMAIREALCGSTFTLSLIANGAYSCLRKVLAEAVDTAQGSTLLASAEIRQGAVQTAYSTPPCVTLIFAELPTFTWRVKVNVTETSVKTYFENATVFGEQRGQIFVDEMTERGLLDDALRAMSGNLGVGVAGSIEFAEDLVLKEREATFFPVHIPATPVSTHPMYNRGYFYFKIANLHERLLTALYLHAVGASAIYGTKERVIYPVDSYDFPATMVVPQVTFFLTAASYQKGVVDAMRSAAENLTYFMGDGVEVFVNETLGWEDANLTRSMAVAPLTAPTEGVVVVVHVVDVDAWWCGLTAVVVGVVLMYVFCGLSMYCLDAAKAVELRQVAANDKFPPSVLREMKETAHAKRSLLRTMALQISHQMVLTGGVGLWLLYSWAYHRKECRDDFLVHCVLVTGIVIVFPFIDFPLLFGCVMFRRADFAKRVTQGRSLTVKCQTYLFRLLGFLWFVNFVVLNVAAWRAPQDGCGALHYHSQVYLILFYTAAVLVCLFAIYAAIKRNGIPGIHLSHDGSDAETPA